MGGSLKVELISDDSLEIFINKYFVENIYQSNDKLVEINNIIDKINSIYKLNLRGFYKVYAYCDERVGMFLELIKIDDNEFSDTADFRIIIRENEKILFEFDLLDDIESKEYYIYNDKFYVDIKNIDNVDNAIEKSRIIYGSATKNIFKLGKKKRFPSKLQ